ncbi:Exocyst complex component 5 [Xylographa parallela]|nr:Exocyst complex component 5 [Xylographa parallela]
MPGAVDTPSSPINVAPNYTRSLFPQAPSFDLATFSSQDFIVKDFIDSLTESTVPANRRSGPSTQQPFDPRPLIRGFEHALKRLSDLSGDLEAKETELSANVRRAEAQHTSNAQSLGRKLDETIDSFRNLDSSLNGVKSEDNDFGGNAAVKIGEKLEELDRQRVRAQDAKFLIQCWLEVSEKGELYLLEDMRRQASGDSKVRCAQIARQLLKISQRLDPGSWSQRDGRLKVVSGVNGANGVNGSNGTHLSRHNTREIVEKFSETLEKDLLTQFDEFYRRANFDGMRDCATVLQDFGGGASVIGMFVNQHQFFIDRSQLITEEIGSDIDTWERLADPDADTPGVEPTLQSLVDEVKVVVQEESAIIKRAFPYYEIVLGRFLQRVFQQSIQQRLEMVLNKANTISTLAFLRSLQASRSYISALVDDLKAHGLTEHPDVLSSQTALILDQQFDDLFVPYFVGSSYIEKEKRNLEELYSSLLFKFTVFHSRRRKVPTTFLASLAKSGSEMLASAKDAYVERLDSSDLAPQQKAMLLRVAGLKDTDSAKRQMDMEFSEQDGLLSTINAKRMLKWLAEAVGRGLELSGGNETPKDVSALLDLLLTHMGELYIDTALDAANDAATAQENTKNEPDLSYLENLQSAITIMHLMLTCINTVLIPLAAANVTIRRDMEKTTTMALNHMEDRVNVLMHRTLDVTLTWIGKLLATQKRTDFRPKDDMHGGGSSRLELLQTLTCLSIFNFLTRVHNLALGALSTSTNLTTFLTELASGIRTLLLDHFKKFQVSAAGGILVTKDISKYIELLRSWELDPAFQPSLEVLTEIGNIFVIGPEALRERLRGKGGAPGGLWEKGDLRPYVLRREDVGSVGVQAVLSAL